MRSLLLAEGGGSSTSLAAGHQEDPRDEEGEAHRQNTPIVVARNIVPQVDQHEPMKGQRHGDHHEQHRQKRTHGAPQELHGVSP